MTVTSKGPESERRTFLGVAAAAAGAAGLPALELGTAPQAGAATAAAPAVAATGTLADVKHVVVLMQENRSFDHYFGRIEGVRGFSDRSALLPDGGRTVFEQKNGTGRQYPWSLGASTGGDPRLLAQCSGGLGHTWSTQRGAWNLGLLDNWSAAVGGVRTMGCLDRADIPFHYALADAYTVCDAYFCSALSGTGANRAFLWSGKIDSTHYDDGELHGCTAAPGRRTPRTSRTPACPGRSTSGRATTSATTR
ncbi:alkaline phosphatase family protein [Streptomyces sp. NPDC001970]